MVSTQIRKMIDLRVARKPVVLGSFVGMFGIGVRLRRPRVDLLLSSSFGGWICTLVFARTSSSNLASSKAPVGHDALAVLEAVGDLDLAAVADAERDRFLVRLVLGVDDHDRRRARRARQHRSLQE